MRTRLFVLLVLLASASVALSADSWPGFRGPAGDGRADGKSVPTQWSEKENVRWKTAIHGKGWSSPVVLGNQVWVTTADEVLYGQDKSKDGETPPPPKKAEPKKPEPKKAEPKKGEQSKDAPKAEKKPAEKDPDEEFRGVISEQVKKEGIEKKLHDRLKDLAEHHNFAAMDSNFEGGRDPDAKGEQLTVLYIRDNGREGAALVAVRVYKKDGRDYMKVLDSSDAVMKNGKTFRPSFIGKDIPVRIF